MRNHYHFWLSWMRIEWAVPSFLAISGYYVLDSYARSGSWKEFIKRRILRIFPALLVSLALIAAFAGPAESGKTFLYYLSCGLWGSSYNGVVWSLGAEEVAYLLLAI